VPFSNVHRVSKKNVSIVFVITLSRTLTIFGTTVAMTIELCDVFSPNLCHLICTVLKSRISDSSKMLCRLLTEGVGGESARARTLWTTFLACAFLLPLTIVCALSAAVLRFQRHRYRYYHEEDRAASPPQHPARQISSPSRHALRRAGEMVETTQNQVDRCTFIVIAATKMARLGVQYITIH